MQVLQRELPTPSSFCLLFSQHHCPGPGSSSCFSLIFLIKTVLFHGCSLVKPSCPRNPSVTWSKGAWACCSLQESQELWGATLWLRGHRFRATFHASTTEAATPILPSLLLKHCNEPTSSPAFKVFPGKVHWKSACVQLENPQFDSTCLRIPITCHFPNNLRFTHISQHRHVSSLFSNSL